jgi:hypothetical protein
VRWSTSKAGSGVEWVERGGVEVEGGRVGGVEVGGRVKEGGREGGVVEVTVAGIGEDGGWGETVGDEENNEKKESRGVVAVTTGTAAVAAAVGRGGGEEKEGVGRGGAGPEEEVEKDGDSARVCDCWEEESSMVEDARGEVGVGSEETKRDKKLWKGDTGAGSDIAGDGKVSSGKVTVSWLNWSVRSVDIPADTVELMWMVSDDWEGELAAAEVEVGGENFDSRAGTLCDVGDVITLERGAWGTRGGEYLKRGGGGGGTTHKVTGPLGRLNAESIDSSSSLLECACSVPYDEIGEEGREGEKECWRRSIVGLCICVPKCDSIPSISSVSSASNVVVANGREVGGEVVLSCVGDLGSNVESPRAVVGWLGVISRGGVVIGTEVEGKVVTGRVEERVGKVSLVAVGCVACVGDCRHLVGGSDRADGSGEDGVEVVVTEVAGIGEDGGWGETVGDEENREKKESRGVVAVTGTEAVVAAVVGGGEEE